MLKKTLFRLARCRFMGRMVGLAFAVCPWAIPGRKLWLSQKAIAFHHPQPSYETHVILSLRRAVSTLQQMAGKLSGEWFFEILKAAMAVHAGLPQSRDGFVLLANGGPKQDVQQVHFHLFTGQPMVRDPLPALPEEPCYQEGRLRLWKHPRPEWEWHFVLTPAAHSPAGDDETITGYLSSVLRSIDELDARYGIVEKGYSLLWQSGGQQTGEWPVFHLIAGKRI